MDHLIAGERDPRVLARLARTRAKAKIPRLEQALDGTEFFTARHAELLRAMLRRIGSLDAGITCVSAVIEELLAPWEEPLQQAESMMDNAFAAVDDVPALQAICHALGPAQIDALLRKWLARLPHPFSPADRAAGYRYDLSILQAEFSLTQMPGKPVSGRIFFEQVIRDNLDLGRPDRISLIFGRSIYRGRKNHTPGILATRVVTDGVTPSLHVLYKHTQIKQYHKHGRALRTETTINQAMDFGLGKRLTNLPALRKIGYTANRRLLAVQRLSHDPITGDSVLRSACDPVIHGNGTRVAGLRLTDPRAQALLHILLIFRLHPRRVPQQGPAQPARRIPRPPAPRPRIGHTRPGHLRPAPAPRARPHRAHPAHPPLPGHQHRPAPRHVPHPRPRPDPANRTRRTHRTGPSTPAQSRHHLPGRHRQPHPPSRNSHLTSRDQT